MKVRGRYPASRKYLQCVETGGEPDRSGDAADDDSTARVHLGDGLRNWGWRTVRAQEHLGETLRRAADEEDPRGLAYLVEQPG